MKQELFTIGRLAGETASKVPTIRYYEQIGLMPEPARSTGNQRLYERRHVDRLAFIRHSRELGFPLDAIRELLNLSDNPDQTCGQVDEIARDQLQQVDRRIASLQALKNELERMVRQCGGGKIAECRIIEVLSDHSQCLAADRRHPPL